ncbi:nitrous oxide reductase accessory protein NosL [Paenibacillus sp. MSJ-34]|uniref:nitrous oxide reductase accessory protein NosL n=1 Tax=Paenibacillus sp. MSJ-34 TaxID=2841529 RepID=UPI001C113A0F|nr:nitrous oxide reductase accessory protein NosL [Paenibacillus sp. MSJ-34]MBU5442958.1 nitrous oxide reductase accessory protein NosL [Paenibacillus sp. MSJ-34]
MKKTVWIGLVIVLIGILAGCGWKEYKPVAIDENVDKCAICNMQVKDDAFATQLTTKDGQNMKFDDIGCMNEWKAKNGTDNIGAQFVRDYNNLEWIKYEDAVYVYDASFKSPMAYGVYSFKDRSSAEQFVAEEGTGIVMNADQLASHSWDRNQDMMHMHGGEDHDAEAHTHSGPEEGSHSESDADAEAHDSHSDTGM